MTIIDTTTCPSCGRATAVCRHSFLGYLAAAAERETWYWSLVAPLGVVELTVPAAHDAARGWNALIGALMQAEGLPIEEAYVKAAAMIEEVSQ